MISLTNYLEILSFLPLEESIIQNSTFRSKKSYLIIHYHSKLMECSLNSRFSFKIHKKMGIS